MSPGIRDILLTIVKDMQSMGEEWKITYVIQQFGNNTFCSNALGMFTIYIPIAHNSYDM
jgi:hypothetical protein